VPVYLKAVRRAAEKNARAVEVVVELMRQASGPPLDSAPFSAVPGPLDRILRQIEIAAQYSSGGIIGFSVPEYMTPLGGQAANELFSRYRLLISGNAGHNP